MPAHPAASILAALLAALALPAQTVHQVGPGGIPQIHAAIALAAPGDVIEVATGTYEPFNLSKALTITAAPGAAVAVAGLLGDAYVVFDIPPGGVARVSGIRFHSLIPFYFGLEVSVIRGIVWFEECLFEQGTHMYRAALEVRNAAVVLRRCVAIGSGGPNNQLYGNGAAGGTALLADRAWVSATETWFLGGDLHWDFGGGHGGWGVDATGSALHLVRCTATGGRNHQITCGSYPGGHGIVVRNNPLGTWLSDCTLQGGDGNCGVAGDGLHNLATLPVQLERTRAFGGVGTHAMGLPLRGPTQPAPLLGLGNNPGFVTLGANWRADWLGRYGTPVAVLVSLDLQPRNDPLAVQRVWFPATSSLLAGLIVVDNAGRASTTITVPNAPVLRHQAVWVHGFAGGAAPWQAAPPLGGVVR